MPENRDLEKAGPADSDIPKDTSSKLNTQAMTWQQREDFGNLTVSEGSYLLSHTLSLPDMPPLCKRRMPINCLFCSQPSDLFTPTTIFTSSLHFSILVELMATLSSAAHRQ
jgi:hypothetical protein